MYPFEEGDEYMERRAWCAHCTIWRTFDLARKPTCFPFARNIETAEEAQKLDLAFEVMEFEAMFIREDPEALRDTWGGRGWTTNPLEESFGPDSKERRPRNRGESTLKF